ncbi:MAG TPA: hypothetical protein VFF06_32675 [Polyangia bacterium]|nr:hypothetical protein [Polyangia bacterium]
MDLIPQNLVEAGDHVVFTMESFVVLFWKAMPTLEGVERCNQAFHAMRLARPKSKIGFLTVIEPESGRTNPGADFRKALSNVLKEHERAIGASVIVFEGSGFRATIVRSIVTGVSLAQRLAFPHSVVSELEPGTRWLIDRLGDHTRLQTAELVSALTRLRARWAHEVVARGS